MHILYSKNDNLYCFEYLYSYKKKIIAKISSVFMDLLTLSSLIVKGMKPSKIVEGKLLKKLSSIHITFLSLP